MLAYRRPKAAAPRPHQPVANKLVARPLEPQHVADALRGRDAVVFAAAQWCPYCRAFEPEFRAMAAEWPFSSAIVVVERQRGDAERRPEASKFRRTYGIKTWPTLLLMRADGQWRKYEGQRSADAIEAAATEFFQA